mmetsp:Transcript_31407/g.79614  ORF Transcript_31407/g.79614 Transcript_31407/m.79614 type:complete len:295 (+) Transcript_31407:164-1048(+)
MAVVPEAMWASCRIGIVLGAHRCTTRCREGIVLRTRGLARRGEGVVLRARVRATVVMAAHRRRGKAIIPRAPAWHHPRWCPSPIAVTAATPADIATAAAAATVTSATMRCRREARRRRRCASPRGPPLRLQGVAAAAAAAPTGRRSPGRQPGGVLAVARSGRRRSSRDQVLHQRHDGVVGSPELVAHLSEVNAQVGHVPGRPAAVLGAHGQARAAARMVAPGAPQPLERCLRLRGARAELCQLGRRGLVGEGLVPWRRLRHSRVVHEWGAHGRNMTSGHGELGRGGLAHVVHEA